MQTVVVATHNSHKVTEIRDILSTANWQLISLSEAGIHDAAIEDADTFVGNAILKARFAHLRTGLPALADDSGLVVDALGGAPGIFSSRYAGEDSDDEANIAKLLQEMADIPDEKRTARFVCATVFIGMAGDEHIAVGSMDGQIAKTASGSGGFGYDPVFIPESSATKKTLAEFSDVEKNAISHRYRALLALQESLESKVTVKTEPDQPVLEQKSAVKIAAFDLDGTLLDAASPVRLVLRLTKDRIMPMRASIRVAAWGVHYKMGSEPDQSLPRHYIFRSLKNVTSSDADAIMRNLYHEELLRFVRPQAREEVKLHKQAGLEVIIASASFYPIVKEAALDFGADGFIATQMEIKDGCYTGKTICDPPEGEQKLLQLRQYLDDRHGKCNWDLVWAYGDHFSDVPLMESATNAVAIDPDRRLERIAKARNWEIREWRI